ncbi:hypothetical protein AOQ84DRAFT_356156 [Glonium stellatum]|uniref:RBR-type E3 ubiquitin transferase n=1 Tax=Glonium stellatum TaxID=574774 RepID=A0A8E2JPL0_9PEZI|nr:hypothetical protein AOQ84DRAFT_356156 [Glonium stellatum]
MVSPRHNCAVCHSRKPEDDFPLTTSGARAFATCMGCLEQSLSNPAAWADLSLQQPGRAMIEPTNDLEANLPSTTPPIVATVDALAETEPSTKSPTRKRKRRSTASSWPYKARKRAKAGPKPPPEPQGPITCRICVEEKPVSEFVKLSRSRKAAINLPFDCQKHLSYQPGNSKASNAVCKSCISSSLSAGLDTVGAERLGCLEPGCEADPWDYSYLVLYLPADALEQYHEQMFAAFMAEETTWQCLNTDCGSVGLLEQNVAGFPNIVCSECKRRSCALCRVEWHEGISCQVYREKHQKEFITSEEKATLRMLSKKGAKRCPRCQMAIEKDGGCDSMYCMHCRRTFAWYSAEPVRSVGTKKAMPKPPPLPDYWQETCEADALANQAAQAGAS